MSKCESCPVDPGKPCHAITYPDSFGHWCELACGGKPIDLMMIRGRSAINAAPRQPTMPAVLSISLVFQMKACPHWVARTNCGCGVNECRAGKGNAGLVSHNDCFVCLQRGAGSGPPAA